MRRLMIVVGLVVVAAACGDGGALRPYPAPPLTSPVSEPDEASTTTTIDPQITARAQSVVLVAADMPGFAADTSTTSTSASPSTTTTKAPSSSTTSARAGAATKEDIDFNGCKAAAVNRLIESPAAVSGATLRRGTGEESAEVTSVAVFGSQADVTAAMAEIGTAEVANCMATQLAGKAATGAVTAANITGVDEAKQIEMTVPRPAAGGTTRNVRFVFVFMRKGDGLAGSLYRAPTTLVRTVDQTRASTTLGTKLVKAASIARPTTTSTTR